MADEPDKTAPQVAAVPQEVTGQQRRVLVGNLPWRHTFASLKHRNFRLFFLGQLVSLSGSWVQNTAQGWLVYQLTGSKVLLGTVAAAGSLPLLLLSVWGGSIADRHSKRQVVLWCQTSLMVLAFAFAALFWSGHIQPWHIILISALGGVAMAFDMPARQAFMAEMTDREDLFNAVSLNSSAVNAARIVGPAIAGYLIAHLDIGTCFLLNGLSFIAVIISLFMMQLPPFTRQAKPESPGQHLLEGFLYVVRHQRLRLLMALFSVVGIFGWSYSVLLPAYASDLLRVGERGYGALLSANGVGALAGALTVATYGKRISSRRLVFGGLWLFSLMLFILAWTGTYAVALSCMVIGGWGMLLYFATVNTLIQTSVSDSMRGRVMGIWALIFGGTMPLGGLESGFMSQHFGIRVTVAAGAVICAVSGLVIMLLARRLDRVGVSRL